MYENITKGRLLNTPRTVISKFFTAIDMLSSKFGVTSLFTRHTNIIVNMIKKDMRNEPNDVNLSALSVLGNDTGNTKTNYIDNLRLD